MDGNSNWNSRLARRMTEGTKANEASRPIPVGAKKPVTMGLGVREVCRYLRHSGCGTQMNLRRMRHVREEVLGVEQKSRQSYYLEVALGVADIFQHDHWEL